VRSLRKERSERQRKLRPKIMSKIISKVIKEQIIMGEDLQYPCIQPQYH
jgi:hypothetical protein